LSSSLSPLCFPKNYSISANERLHGLNNNIYDKILRAKDNKLKIKDIIMIGDLIMKKFVTFIQDVLLINNDDNSHRIGLSQFKRDEEEKKEFSANRHSIIDGDVKLSDLLRRA